MSSPAIASVPLRGRRLAIARVVWIALVLLILALLVIGAPARYHQLLALSSENNRALLQLNPEEGRALRPLGLSLGFYATYFTLLEAIFTLVFAAIGLVIFWRRSIDGWVMFVAFTLVSLGATLTPFMDALAAALRPAWGLPITYVQLIGTGCFLVFLYLFPDGRWVPRWTRWLAVVWVLWLLVTPLLFDLSPSGPAINLFDAAALGWFATGVVAQIYRYLRVSNSLQRQASKWAVLGLVVTLLADTAGGLLYILLRGRGQPGVPTVLFNLILAPVFVFSLLVVPLSISFAILRYRLWDIDRLLNRTLVYGTLTTFIIGMYVLAVGGLGELLQTRSTLAPVLLTTVAIIALLRPLRARLQAGMDRLTASRGTAEKQMRLKRGAARGHDADALRDDKPVAPIRLSLLDYLFRALAIVGVLEIAALAATLIAHPDAPGLIGQGLVIRIWFGLVVAPAILLVGALGVWRMPGNAVGRFLILIALGGIGAQFNFDLGAPLPSALAVESIILFNAGLVGPSLGYLMLTFPTGRVYPAHWSRAVILAAIVKFFGALLEILASPGKIKIFAPTLNPLFLPALAPYQPLIAVTIGITGLLLPLILLAGLISLALRYRASPVPERQQIKWVLWGFGLLVPAGATTFGLIFRYGFASMPFPIAYVFAAGAQTLFLTSIAIAILRHHLFDIDILINRTLVYGSLTLIVVGLYVLAVGYLSELFHESGSFILSLLATGLIAVFFQPLRERLQRGVNRLMYGERDDPYAVLSRLGQRLEATLAPGAVLPTLAETIAQTLKLPYVAIALQRPGGNDSEIAAAYGLPTGSAVRLPLAYQAERVGELLIAPRAPDEAFTPAEQRLLADIAHQAGVAAHAVRLTADLQRSRERLVTTREEERRRLRRDLHDGLGPALAVHSLKVGSVRSLLTRHLPDHSSMESVGQDIATADSVLAELERDIAAALTDIRRLVYDLRPPTLDELGLVAAIRESAARYAPTATPNANALRITVDAPERLSPLPAAVEVAAFRITQEALTNVVRHAQARMCLIRLKLEDGLWVEITDDGVGLPAPQNEHPAGVGLASMRERAEELGGTCTIESLPTGGTRVLARLPLS
jgi:signal transduction histidine kinase